jgi:NAD-dependent aldehyde dehydrogenases
MNDTLPNHPDRLRSYFNSGATLTYEFRKKQLLLLRSAVLKHEHEIYSALYSDLKKNKEESWVTEIGFLIAEINHTLKHLKQWMKRKKVPTNLLNLPSKSYIYKDPLGVVLIIGPWNYPLQLLFTPLVGAIAAGNCVVLKPSEFAPATAAIMEKIISETFSQDYIFYVQGKGNEVIPPMMNQFRFDHVFYTGSTQVGKIIYKMAAEQLIPVTLELGGKSPCIVDKDADIKIAAKRIAVTKFSNAGQMCVAPDYVLVHQSRKEEFLNALKETIISFFTNDPSGNDEYAKMINRNQFERVLSYIKEGTLVYGGRSNHEALYIEPTIIEEVRLNSNVMNQEIFGPVLPVLSYSDFDEALNVIRQNPNPLAFYIFTNNKNTEYKWLQSVSFGGGCVNNASWHLTNYNLPFGGIGNSGLGNYHGKNSFDVFTHHKSVMKTPTWFDPKIKYPPFKGKLNLFKKIIR